MFKHSSQVRNQGTCLKRKHAAGSITRHPTPVNKTVMKCGQVNLRVPWTSTRLCLTSTCYVTVSHKTTSMWVKPPRSDYTITLTINWWLPVAMLEPCTGWQDIHSWGYLGANRLLVTEVMKPHVRMVYLVMNVTAAVAHMDGYEELKCLRAWLSAQRNKEVARNSPVFRHITPCTQLRVKDLRENMFLPSSLRFSACPTLLSRASKQCVILKRLLNFDGLHDLTTLTTGVHMVNNMYRTCAFTVRPTLLLCSSRSRDSRSCVCYIHTSWKGLQIGYGFRWATMMGLFEAQPCLRACLRAYTQRQLLTVHLASMGQRPPTTGSAVDQAVCRWLPPWWRGFGPSTGHVPLWTRWQRDRSSASTSVFSIISHSTNLSDNRKANANATPAIWRVAGNKTRVRSGNIDFLVFRCL
jgi:hypothetical protein